MMDSAKSDTCDGHAYPKRVMITGGTGSLGSRLIPLLLTNPSLERIVVYSRDEQKQWHARANIQDDRVAFYLGDVRDRERLAMAMRGMDAVIHAAALKIVPKGEGDPSEFIKTNVLGTDNVIHAALQCGVKKVLGLSTDKAVAPINLYGATKLTAEKMLIAANVYHRTEGPVFSVIRYGNVCDSRGSVIPLWRDKAAKGEPLPLTHPDMTRFWITLPEAAHMVHAALLHMQGGEVFIPKMPAFRLADLSTAMGRIGQEFTDIIGIRPGEKLHEDLITVHEARMVDQNEHVFVLVPGGIKPANPVPEGFRYASNTVGYLSIDQLKWMLKYV